MILLPTVKGFSMTSSAKFRVVIDMQPDGDFLVYSDPEVARQTDRLHGRWLADRTRGESSGACGRGG